MLRARMKLKKANNKRVLLNEEYGRFCSENTNLYFPHCITDHRINLTLYKLEEVMLGKLEFLTEPLRQQNQIEQLKNQGVET